MRPRAPWALQGPLDDTSASSPLLLWVLGVLFRFGVMKEALI